MQIFLEFFAEFYKILKINVSVHGSGLKTVPVYTLNYLISQRIASKILLLQSLFI